MSAVSIWSILGDERDVNLLICIVISVEQEVYNEVCL
jgi:hypothetical protein